MSDALLERIAKSLELIAKVYSGGAAAPPGAAGSKTPPAGPATGGNKATPATGGNKGAAGGAGAGAGAGANKGAGAGANKGAAPAAAKAPGGKYNSEQVRDIIRKVATNPSLGKQSALDILDQDGGGVTNVTNLKPENFDKVFEAASALLSSEGGGEPAAGADDDFDPTA